MDAGLVHVEILGPRLGLDDWLRRVQRHGGCHLADALAGLEGHAGVGRPSPREEERRAAELRAAALIALRALSGVLPPAPRPAADEGWSLPPGGVDEARLRDRVERACALARGLREAEVRAAQAASVVDGLEAARAAARAAARLGLPALPAMAFGAGPGGAARRLERAARRAGARAARAGSGGREVVVADAAGAQAALEAAGAIPIALPPELVGRPPAEAEAAIQRAWPAAAEAERAARQALAERSRREGPEARQHLDGLEDAEARGVASRLLAATAQVVALRAYVAREQLRTLEEALARAGGPPLVLRRLAPGPDAPGPVRSLPAPPLAALRALAPARLGSRAASGALALALAPLAAFLAGDVAVGLLLLFGGAWLGAGAQATPARREAGLWAQISGLAALLAGLLSGRALGALGERLLGTGWGAWPGLPDTLSGRVRLLALATAVGAALLAAWAQGVLLLRQARRDRRLAPGATALLRSAGLTALVAWGLARESSAPVLAAAAYALVVGLLSTPGERQRLLADVLATGSAFALALLVVAGLPWALGLLDGPAAGLGGAVALLLAALLTLDPCRVALGFPHEVLLQGGAEGAPFTAFASGSLEGAPAAFEDGRGGVG